ncbi:hypothetical protein [Bosea sp. ANAM02]|uniref:hypothetical protein n=1 Tax=Bosea sp. ANAM02 TaxID=2020412 RepID=UPI00140EA8F4|nr:hypothetical protein [Bosea sp. ANAM02]BCB20293.1 hypothetical protein OCUBac02_31870 [Bosea sp. ANAM02]
MKHALALAAILLLTAPAVADSRDKPVSKREFNALMTQLYGSKGPASTSRARGFYKGGNGEWRRR